MAQIWPWLAVAGLGALHGLNPATGWLFAAAWGVRSGDRTQARRALLPIALGHAVSVGLVATAVALLPAFDEVSLPALQAAAGLLLVGVVLVHWRGRHSRDVARLGSTADWWGRTTGRAGRAGRAGLALWSFIMATAHGAGLMLVPALVPLCLSNTPAREITASGSLTLALAAVALHMTAMLAVTASLAAGACGAAEWWRRRRVVS